MVSDKTLMRVQALSGAAFGAFSTVHLVNHMLAPFLGQQGYDSFMMGARKFYQTPLGEYGLVLGSLGVHMTCNMIRFVRRKRSGIKNESLPMRSLLHRYTGYILGSVIFAHIAATRSPPVFFGIPFGFYAVAFTLEKYPLIFYPYYAIFSAAGVYHTCIGFLKALSLFFPPKQASVQKKNDDADLNKTKLVTKKPFYVPPYSKLVWGTVAVATVGVLYGLYALGGNLYDIDRSGYPEIEALKKKLAAYVGLKL